MKNNNSRGHQELHTLALQTADRYAAAMCNPLGVWDRDEFRADEAFIDNLPDWLYHDIVRRIEKRIRDYNTPCVRGLDGQLYSARALELLMLHN